MWTMTCEKTIEDYNVYKYIESADKNTSIVDEFESQTNDSEGENRNDGRSGFCQVIADGLDLQLDQISVYYYALPDT